LFQGHYGTPAANAVAAVTEIHRKIAVTLKDKRNDCGCHYWLVGLPVKPIFAEVNVSK
jgi:hypothetical protein